MHARPWYCSGGCVSWSIPGTSLGESKMSREAVAWHRCELKVDRGRVITEKL